MLDDELRSLVKSVGAQRVPSVEAFDFGLRQVTAGDLLGRQTEILDGVRRMPGTVFLVYDEHPRDWELGEWRSPGKNTWIVPPDPPSGALLADFLEPGNWRLYVASDALPPDRWPDAFKGDLAAIAHAMSTHGISVLIDSWHDNTDWRIVFPTRGTGRHASASGKSG